MQQKISGQNLQLFQYFVQITDVGAKDMIMDEKGIIFIVPMGQLGKAIGKQAANLFHLRKTLNKNVEIYEEAPSAEDFLRKFFQPLAINEVQAMDEKHINLKFNDDDKGLAIGKSGERIKKAKMLCQRLFDTEEVRIV